MIGMQKKLVGLPKMVNNEHWKSEVLKSAAQLRATEQRITCTVLLGFHVDQGVVVKK